VQIELQKTLNYSLLGLAVLGGIIAGSLAGQVVDLLLSREEALPLRPVIAQPAGRQLQEADFQVILDRNLFDSQAVGQASERVDLSSQQVVAQNPTASAPRGELTLIGTVVAGESSLALIQQGSKAAVYRLQQELAPGTVLIEVGRQMAAVREGGVRRELLLKPRKESRARQLRRGTSPNLAQGDVVALGENRWQVSKAAADNARANLNTLLQTARMVPQLQNGKTIGFRLVELDRGSLLEQIGLRVGDLVVEINQVELNSPEKALQIFQQVREASNISVGLVRNGKKETFEYRFE